MQNRERQLQYEQEADANAAAVALDNLRKAVQEGDMSLPHKPIMGCSVILEGRPMLIPMIMNNDGRWIGRL